VIEYIGFFVITKKFNKCADNKSILFIVYLHELCFVKIKSVCYK